MLPVGKLKFPAWPAPCDYVRFVNDDDEETVYYDQAEWRDAPAEVMGAIMALILNGVDNLNS